MSFYLVLTNDFASFKGTLSQTYERPFHLNGDWEVAITYLRCQDKGSAVYVDCDLVNYGYFNNKRSQLLHVSDLKSYTVNRPRYVKVIKKRFWTINMKFAPNSNLSYFRSTLDIICVLHFRKA